MKIYFLVNFIFANTVFAQTPSASPSAIGKHPFTFEDMMKFKRDDRLGSCGIWPWLTEAVSDNRNAGESE